MEHPPVTGRKNARVDGLRIMTLTKQSFQACQLLFLMDCQMIKKNSTCVSINFINDNIHCSSSTRKCVLWFIFHVKKFNSINNYFMLMNLLLGSVDDDWGSFSDIYMCVFYYSMLILI